MIDILLANSVDILNLALSFAAIVLTLFIVLVLIRLFKVLGTLDDVLMDVQDILEIVQTYLWQPARFFMALKNKFLSLFSFLKK